MQIIYSWFYRFLREVHGRLLLVNHAPSLADERTASESMREESG